MNSAGRTTNRGTDEGTKRALPFNAGKPPERVRVDGRGDLPLGQRSVIAKLAAETVDSPRVGQVRRSERPASHRFESTHGERGVLTGAFAPDLNFGQPVFNARGAPTPPPILAAVSYTHLTLPTNA